jgi:hypothetical protein
MACHEQVNEGSEERVVPSRRRHLQWRRGWDWRFACVVASLLGTNQGSHPTCRVFLRKTGGEGGIGASLVSSLRSSVRTKVLIPPAAFFFEKLAERVGFEPTVPCGTPDFESGTFDHSDTSPAVKTRVDGYSAFLSNAIPKAANYSIDNFCLRNKPSRFDPLRSWRDGRVV